VIDGLGRPQSVGVLGGASAIGLAIARECVALGARRLVLAGRDESRLEREARRLESDGADDVSVVSFDAAATQTHDGVVTEMFARGDLDVMILAFGVLGEQAAIERDPDLALEVAEVNYLGAVSVGLRAAARLRAQGHGSMVVMSSAAAVRARKSNFVYGSSKAGLDAFAHGLGDSLHGSGVRVIVVRPGFVGSPMTAGLHPAPLATTPDAVAAGVIKALRSGAGVVWVPPALGPVMLALRLLPRPVFRRLPI
jgi:decaprenylphospho-beta-D-erythro-pentofuranosid-2-ulose 2-reductase